jgi:hypothetical protein
MARCQRGGAFLVRHTRWRGYVKKELRNQAQQGELSSDERVVFGQGREDGGEMRARRDRLCVVGPVIPSRL